MKKTLTSRAGRLAGLLAAIVAAAMLIVPASSMAGPDFGSKLDPSVQPSNANSPHPCEPTEGQQCTRVLMEGYQRPDLPNAPKSGKIKQIKLIAGAPGSFRLQIAKANPQTKQAKIVRNGPKISYVGQTADEEPYRVESFKVKLKVKKGEYLAIKSKETSTLRCSSGGPNNLIFQPTLKVGGPFTTASEDDGCWLLLEAVMK